MSLDIRTIVVMLMLSAALMSLTLFCGLRAGRSAGFAKWNAGLGLYTAGWLLVAARGMLPDAATVAFAHALLVSGICFQIAALREFDGRSAPVRLLALPGALLFVLLLPQVGHYPALTMTASSANAAALLGLAWHAVSLGKKGGGVRWLMAGVCAAGAAGLMVRALDIWLRPQATPDLFAGGLLHDVAFLLLFAVTVSASTAFLVMHRARAEHRLRHLATFDALTGLFNRRAFMDLAQRELARCARAKAPWALLLIDLDHFKKVNDRFGHQAGDRLLEAAGAELRRCVRREDLAGRYGGEEFCVLLPGADAGTAAEVGERVREAFAARALAGLPEEVTASVGVAAVDAQAASGLDAVIARADRALYRAKRAGRNRVLVNEQHRHRAERRGLQRHRADQGVVRGAQAAGAHRHQLA